MSRYSIYYSGGSGGFMFFYSLQLALGYDVKELIEENWDIQDPSRWKESETFCLFDPELRLNDIKLYCNRPEPHDDATSIGLYTDLKTQIDLAHYKNAAFFNKSNGMFDLFVEEVIHNYKAVGDPSWPEVTSFEDFDKLPDWIKEELINVFDFPKELSSYADWLYHERLKTSTTVNGLQVLDTAASANEFVDHCFLLQDVVNTKFKCVCDALHIAHTQDVADHVDHWVSLHPAHIQARLRGEDVTI